MPRHSFKLGADFAVTAKLSIGGDAIATSGQYLRSDEANLLAPTGGYAVVNLRANYAVTKRFSVFARIDNVPDRHYVTFGTLGQPSEETTAPKQSGTPTQRGISGRLSWTFETGIRQS
jgi:outer membrane receptor for ferric coprogen and ferric-rhodotorulic acid